MNRTVSIQARILVVVGLLCLGACRSTLEQALEPVYASVELAPRVTVERDLAYLEGEAAHPQKHRLDLYLPPAVVPVDGRRGDRLPVLLFVHGGSLAKGDKDLEVVGLDFYRNIGRFYSSRGVAVALVNYRLQPEVSWRDQVDDVAAAASFVRQRILDSGAYGAGVEPRLFLAGHSAGAWLALRVTLDRAVRERHGLDERAIGGVVSVSGSGFEMTDRRTWELYAKEDFWAERFAVDPPADWRVEASIVPLVEGCSCPDGPRVLLLYSNHELLALARQNRLLAEAFERFAIDHRLVAVSSESHRRTVMAMSHPRKIVSREVLAFLHTRDVDLGPRSQRKLLSTLGER